MPRIASDAAFHVGRRIADHRTQLGLTQDQLAVESGIDSSNVRAYENGRAMPSIHSLVRIAFALGVKPGALLDELTPELFAKSPEDGQRRAG